MLNEDLDWADEVLGPTRPSLDSLTAAGHAFAIPWSRQPKVILAGFESSRARELSGPWVLPSPFDAMGTKLTTIIHDQNYGTTSFKEAFSGRMQSSTDHLSAALSITIGYPFLNASVSGEYDKTVVKNENAVQASRNSACRVGRLLLQQTPAFSTQAISILRNGGPDKFRQVYGDYFVCGFELGADAGACMSASTKSQSEAERLKITVKVKVLMVSASYTHEESSSSYSSSSSITFCGYNTLEGSFRQFANSGASIKDEGALRQAAAEFANKVASLESEVRSSLAKLGLRNGRKLPLSAAPHICESGLVAQLLLAPYARLNQYVSILG